MCICYFKQRIYIPNCIMQKPRSNFLKEKRTYMSPIDVSDNRCTDLSQCHLPNLS